MNKDAAQEIAPSVCNAELALDAAIENLRTSVSNQAADPCHFELPRLCVVFVQSGASAPGVERDYLSAAV